MNKSIEDQILDILEDYKDQAEDIVTKSAKKVSGECVTKLRAVNKFSSGSKKYKPVVTGEYSKSWNKKKSGTGYVVYNKEHYRLTHLLENGHLSKNQYGTYDRVPAYKHISDVEEWGNKEYLDEVKRELNLIK